MKVVIIGLGLIGGSICMGLADSGVATDIVGADAHPDAINYFLSRGYLTERVSTYAHHADADLWVIAVPPNAICGVLEQIAPHVKREAVVTDCTSVKSAVNACVPQRIKPNFIGGHPIAGLASSHYSLAKPDLFQDAHWVLCATDETSRSVIRRVETLVYSLDAQPIWMSAEEHDHHIALLSHIPHALAALLVMEADRLQNPEIAGTSWGDLTRVAGNYPELWKQIFKLNRSAIHEHILSIREGLDRVEWMLREGSDEDLLSFFKDAESCKPPRPTPKGSSKLSAS